MRIIKMDIKEEWEQNYKKEEFIRHIIEHILIICKYDKNFNIGDKTSRIEESIKNAQDKIKNKDKLLSKSDEMRKSLVDKLTELENENFRMKVNLLESLGLALSTY